MFAAASLVVGILGSIAGVKALEANSRDTANVEDPGDSIDSGHSSEPIEPPVAKDSPDSRVSSEPTEPPEPEDSQCLKDLHAASSPKSNAVEFDEGFPKQQESSKANMDDHIEEHQLAVTQMHKAKNRLENLGSIVDRHPHDILNEIKNEFGTHLPAELVVSMLTNQAIELLKESTGQLRRTRLSLQHSVNRVGLLEKERKDNETTIHLLFQEREKNETNIRQLRQEQEKNETFIQLLKEKVKKSDACITKLETDVRTLEEQQEIKQATIQHLEDKAKIYLSWITKLETRIRELANDRKTKQSLIDEIQSKCQKLEDRVQVLLTTNRELCKERDACNSKLQVEGDLLSQMTALRATHELLQTKLASKENKLLIIRNLKTANQKLARRVGKLERGYDAKDRVIRSTADWCNNLCRWNVEMTSQLELPRGKAKRSYKSIMRNLPQLRDHGDVVNNLLHEIQALQNERNVYKAIHGMKAEDLAERWSLQATIEELRKKLLVTSISHASFEELRNKLASTEDDLKSTKNDLASTSSALVEARDAQKRAEAKGKALESQFDQLKAKEARH